MNSNRHPDISNSIGSNSTECILRLLSKKCPS